MNGLAAWQGDEDRLRPFALHDRLFFVALCLLPFSLDKEIVVISYAIPFFAILCLYYVTRFIHDPVRIDPQMGGVIIASVGILAVMTATSLLADDEIRSLTRVAIHGGGVLLLTYFCTQAGEMPATAGLLRFYRLARAFAISGALMAGYYVVNFVYQSFGHGVEAVIGERFGDGLGSLTWGASNTVAGALLLPLAIAFVVLSTPPPPTTTFLEREAQRLERARWIGLSLAMVAGITFTLSRNGITMMALLTLFFLGRSFSTAMIVMVAAAVTSVYLLSLDQGVTDVIWAQRVYSADLSSLNNRVEIWEFFVEYIRENPFNPIGYYTTNLQLGSSGHNFVLTTYVEQSVLGVVLAAVLTLMLLRRALKLARLPGHANRAHGYFFALALGVIAMNLQFEDANFTHQYILYFWIFVALLCYRFSIGLAFAREAQRRPG